MSSGRSVTAHFFGGPRDGAIEVLESAPYSIEMSQLARVQWRGGDTVDEIVPARTIIYRRRGPALAGHAYYDWIEG